MRIQPEMIYFDNEDKMYNEAVNLICKSAKEAILCSGGFSMVLAGGTTPLPVYRRLLYMNFPWEMTDFFWSDERCTGIFDKTNNYGNAFKEFLHKAPVKPENIHRIKTELPPEKAARSYDKELNNFKIAKNRSSLFDLVVLGMGEDGHTASLFPDSEALQEKDKLAVAVPPPIGIEPSIERVTLTYPAIADSKAILFLVKGKEKKELLESGRLFPASAVESKKIMWFIA